jgi:hypothetical protein
MYPYHRQFPIQIPGFPQFGGQGGFPPSGPPGGFGPDQPPFGPPGYGQGGPGQGGPPLGPPPSEIPPVQGQGQFGVYAVDPGGIRGCLYRYTYIRLENGRAFWYFPTFVGRNSVAGWRWRRRQYRWVYFGIDLDRIQSFSCR